MTKLQQKLFEQKDTEYQSFSQKLIPGQEADHIIGVRVPIVRAIAKEFAGSKEATRFLQTLPHKYHEENLVHIYLINGMKDWDEWLASIEAFMPFITNWAVCDNYNYAAVKKNPEESIGHILRWLKSDSPYTIRYAAGLLMSCYLDANFDPKHLRLVAEIRSDHYYVNMMRAWYFATALAKQYDETVSYITDKKMDAWTHNKSIQKACESFRVSDEHKAFLKKFKVSLQ